MNDESTLKEIILSDDRSKSKLHYCCYCPDYQGGTKISRHLRIKHSNENEVKKAMDEKDPEVAILSFARLKLRGDHLHNLEVMIKKCGYLVVARANPNENPEDYMPCAFCKVCDE